MSLVIVPDDILDRRVCDYCHKYLSASPVKVAGNHIFCGRCVNRCGTESVNSAYELFGQNALFKCVNRYQGCDKLLSFGHVITHEETCRVKFNKCLICPEDTPELPIYLLPYHVKTRHESLYLTEKRFTVEIKPNERSIFFYKENNYLFFISHVYDSVKKNAIFVECVGRDVPEIKSDAYVILDEEIKMEANKTICKEEKHTVTISFEIETPIDVMQIPYQNGNLSNLELHADFFGDRFTDHSALRNYLMRTTMADGIDNKCKWARLLQFKQIDTFEQPNKVSLSQCRTKLIVNDFSNNIFICFHCILCKNVCSNFTKTFFSKSGSLKHLVCFPCSKYVREIIQIEPLMSIMTEDMFRSIKFTCFRQCEKFFTPNDIFKHYKYDCKVLLAPKVCCIENCLFLTSKLDLFSYHFDIVHEKKLCFPREYMTYCIYIGHSAKQYFLYYDTFIEVTLDVENTEYCISARICDRDSERDLSKLHLMMFVIDTNCESTDPNYVQLFFKTKLKLKKTVSISVRFLIIEA